MKNIILFACMLIASISISYSQEKPTYLCGAITKKGTPCRNKVTEAGKRCWVHGGETKTDVKMISAQCSAIAKSTGNQCRNKTTNPNGLCHVHSKQGLIVNYI